MSETTGKNIKKLCTIPISADDTHLKHWYLTDEPFPEDWESAPTRQIAFPANSFLFITELARILHEGTRWNKKARIVLEYDPGQPKFTVTTFMESGESVPLLAKESRE